MTALASLTARFPSTPAAADLPPASPFRTSSTNGAMPPASAIATLLASLNARLFFESERGLLNSPRLQVRARFVGWLMGGVAAEVLRVAGRVRKRRGAQVLEREGEQFL